MATTATLYRFLVCVGLLGGLASCGRATYSFSNEAERRQPSAEARSVASDTAVAPERYPAAPTRLVATRLWAARRPAAILASRRRARLSQPAQPAGCIRPHLAGRQPAGRTQPAATSGALVTAGTLDGLFMAVLLYALLFAVLIGTGLYLLGKLMRWGLLKWTAHRRASRLAAGT